MVELPPVTTLSDTLAAIALARLDDALRNDVRSLEILRCLAQLAPKTCLELLADRSQEFRAMFPPAEVSELALSAMRAFGGSHAERSAAASSIVREYTSILTQSAASEIGELSGPFAGKQDRAAFKALLERFPSDPALLRVAVRESQANEYDDIDALLTRLGQADSSPANVSYVYRARRAAPGRTPGIPSRVALVSSYTIDGLVPYVDLASRNHGIDPQIYVAPFNSWMRDFIDPSSGLRTFEPDITFLSIAIDDLIPELAGYVAPSDLELAGKNAVERVIAVVDAYVAWAAGKPLVVHGFHSAFTASFGTADGRETISRGEWLADIDARLGAALRERPACFKLDVAQTVTSVGASFYDNAKLRHIASMRLPPTALGGIGEAYARYIVPASGLARKCVVLDLDNTLWGGIVGEDGKDGIRLGTSAPGSEFVEFQTFLKSLAARGILLAINSKNNGEDALEVIRTHESMVLRERSFSAIRINWQPKTENMIEIARELNIGIDSLVFVDDNPDERDRMRQLLPDVLTVEMPKDPTQYRATLDRLPQLQTLAITAEDRQRLVQYETARLRIASKADAGTVEDYLRSLEIEVSIEPCTEPCFARVAQLFSKTNQFNTTTHRYTLADVERFARSTEYTLLTLSSSDRFGSHGLVAVALMKHLGKRCDIDSFLMSCRVIGYGIEAALLSAVAQTALAAGARELSAAFVESRKNAPAKDLFASNGFSRVASDSDAEVWAISLTAALPFPTWITRKS